MSVLFQSLSQEAKVDFFVKCQELMIKFHPLSSFIIRENTLSKALDAFQNNINNYKGYIFSSDDVCVLWNHIVVSDPTNVNLTVTQNAYKEPNINYNAISLDFVIFRRMQDCVEFVRANYETKIQYILFIREGVPKLYKTEDLLKKIIK